MILLAIHSTIGTDTALPTALSLFESNSRETPEASRIP